MCILPPLAPDPSAFLVSLIKKDLGEWIDGVSFAPLTPQVWGEWIDGVWC